MWATRRAKDFLLGRKFILTSDHKPLKFIFDTKREIPRFTSARIQRWALELMGLDYEIQHCQGKMNAQADAMSRLQFHDDLVDENNAVSHLFHWENNKVSLKDIKEETLRDSFLQRIIKRTVNNNWKNCSVKEKAYKRHKQILCVEEDILLKGTVPIIPEVLRMKVMEAAHVTHGGVMATNLLLKQEAWWPGFTQDVEKMVKECLV